jgi:hypothetical protein
VADAEGVVSNAATVTITITPVADTPTLGVPPAVVGDEAAAIPLSMAAALADTDGSESLALTIGGVPASATLSAGTNLGGVVWALTPAQFAGLTITLPDNLPGGAAFTLTVTATATEAGSGSTATATATTDVTVRNVAPQKVTIAGPTAGVRGQTLSYSGRFTDPGTADTHTLAWAVTRTGATVAAGAGGVFSFAPTESGPTSSRSRSPTTVASEPRR